MHGTDDWPLAEIISIKEHNEKSMYYVHYVDCKEDAEIAFCLYFFVYFVVVVIFSQQTFG